MEGGLVSEMENIKNYIPDYESTEYLPMFHSPGDLYLDSILKSGEISSRRNNFFFYGRPSYCLLRSASKLRRSSFIVSVKENNFEKIYLFDSGGFYSHGISEKLGNERDFYSLNNISHVNDVITYFWGSLNAYARSINDSTQELVESDELPEKLKTYAALIVENSVASKNESVVSTKDILTHSVEMQTRSPKNIKSTLLAVILPYEEFYKQHIRQAINDLGCEAVNYKDPKSSPFKTRRVIMKTAFNYLVKKGVV